MVLLASLIGWGVIYQGYNAIFPSFWTELFPTRVRVSATAISQNIGFCVTAFLPMLFAAIAPPGSANIPLTIGIATLGLACVGACAAWSAREPYRIRLDDLGRPDAKPVGMEEFLRLQAEAAHT